MSKLSMKPPPDISGNGSDNHSHGFSHCNSAYTAIANSYAIEKYSSKIKSRHMSVSPTNLTLPFPLPHIPTLSPPLIRT